MSALVRKTRRHPRGTVIGVLVTESIVTDAYRTYSLDATSVHDEYQRPGATDQIPRDGARLALRVERQHRAGADTEIALLNLLIRRPEPPDGEGVGARLRVEHRGQDADCDRGEQPAPGAFGHSACPGGCDGGGSSCCAGVGPARPLHPSPSPP